MSHLEAIRLVKHIPPEDVSAEQAEMVRAVFEASPGMPSAVGGREVVEQFLTDVEAALARPQQSNQRNDEATGAGGERPAAMQLGAVVAMLATVLMVAVACWILLPIIFQQHEHPVALPI